MVKKLLIAHELKEQVRCFKLIKNPLDPECNYD